MSYALIVNGAVSQYPYSFAALRRDNPQVSFPREATDERLAEFGVVKLAAVARPVPGTGKNVVEGQPALVGDVWTQVWTEVDATPEEIASRAQQAADDAARLSVKADAFVTSFIAMTPAEVTAHIEANVTNLASAKNVISKLALMVLLLARREFRDE